MEGLKRQPVVVQGLPAAALHDASQLGKALRKLQADGVPIAFKLSDTPADAMAARLKGLMAWSQIDFEAESVALDKVTNEQVKRFAIRYLRSKSLTPLLGREGEGGQLVRVIVDHAEGKLTIQELIDRAKRGDYRNRHVILVLGNDSPVDLVSFCAASVSCGALSITIPSGRICLPVAILTAESLVLRIPAILGQYPQAAWKKAEADVLEKLKAVETAANGNDREAIRLIDEAFPVEPRARKMSEMFLGERGATKDTIDRIKQFIKAAERNTWNQLI